MKGTTQMWYYYNESGAKIGPVKGSVLKHLVQQGVITSETIVENEGGKSVPAKKLEGVTFPEPVFPNEMSAVSSAANNPFVNISLEKPSQPAPSPFTTTPFQMRTADIPVQYREFIHPDDDIALQRLKAVPGLQTFTKQFMEMGFESQFHGLCMTTKIRISPTQLPNLYKHLPPICRKFGIAEPEFFLEMNPFPNSYTYGVNRSFLVITSGLLAHIKNDEELIAVLAHECGHILCQHVLYNTMAGFLSIAAEIGGVLGGIGSMLTGPIRWALSYWSRCSELSADRAELVYLGDTVPVLGVLTRLSGGPAEITSNINFEEFASQADVYKNLQGNSKWQRFLEAWSSRDNDHPSSAIRIREIMMWEKSEQYRRLRARFEQER
ncbi:MAG: M48 family metalloprotease [Planctomycetaceae bacterium]|jgi:Zn-dependent protease with chaperone function|nr:M48 family metalloprotease [Planctomycetaceae bacterium]